MELSTKLMELYYKDHDILQHQKDSYNDYIDNIIPNILNQFFPININILDDKIIKKISIQINNINISDSICMENNGSSRIMTPKLARLRNYTYSLCIYLDLKIYISIKENDSIIELPGKTVSNVLLGRIPIIVGSKYCMLVKYPHLFDECKYDRGGYLIINGNEKVIISQEKIARNNIQIFKSQKANNKYGYIAEIRSSDETLFNIPKTISYKITDKKYKYDNLIYISLPNVSVDIPIIIIFKLLGYESHKQIIYSIIDNNNLEYNDEMKRLLLPSMNQLPEIKTKADAYTYISKYLQGNIINSSMDKKINYIKTYIIDNYLPHIKIIENKILYTGYIINSLLKCFIGIEECDDRDSYVNKRIETPGVLLGNLTYQCVSKLVRDAKNLIIKEVNTELHLINNNYNDIINEVNIHKIFKSNYLDNTLKTALATGNWGMKNNLNKQGVSQVLNRLSYVSTLSHLRRIASNLDSSSGKLIQPRKLHSSSWGMICPSETPEGISVGLIKNLSMMCEITQYSNSYSIRDIIKEYLISLNDIDIYTYDKLSNTKIFINGDWLGYTDKIDDLISTLKQNRGDGIIHYQTSFYHNYDKNILFINTDRGRCIRPLLKTPINNNIYNINNWDSLIISSFNKYNKQFIEYIDCSETNNIMIMPQKITNKDVKYTHAEIDESLILGLLASCIPFAHHNQSPRNTYQAAMGKQAIGITVSNFNDRYDTFSNILNYPQRPLIDTKIMDILNLNKLPNGINVIVAIGIYKGYNQEDSIIFNEGSIGRGLFASTFYRTYKSEEKKNQLTGEEDKFCKPDKDNILFPKNSNYDKLDESGFVKKNTYLNNSDIIIGKISPLKKEDIKYQDNSVSIKNNEECYIDSNYIDKNEDGYRFCKIRTRYNRYPIIGDKFSSRHGQKGTIGITLSEADMPFTKDGIKPDIIINPHAIPSRMTIAQLLECLLGKVCLELGYFGDSTAFNKDINLETLTSILKNLNYEENGNEILYNGTTGEQMHCNFFMGPTYYQRLKHMSTDKIHSRSCGPIVSMTRQPSEGRSSHGGLRFGEMERDCMIAHGACNFLKERLLDVSDKFTVFVCNNCGGISISNPKKVIYNCKKCNNFNNFNKVQIPYSFKLLLQELESMSISTNMITNDLKIKT